MAKKPAPQVSNAVNIASRILAVVLLFMLCPVLFGWWLDRTLGTSWITPASVVFATGFSLFALTIVLKKIELDEKMAHQNEPPPHYKSSEEIDREEEEYRSSNRDRGESDR